MNATKVGVPSIHSLPIVDREATGKHQKEADAKWLSQHR